MATKRHQQDEKTFEELTYAEQAKSITSTINYLARAIKANQRRANDGKRTDPLNNRIQQILRMIIRLGNREES